MKWFCRNCKFLFVSRQKVQGKNDILQMKMNRYEDSIWLYGYPEINLYCSDDVTGNDWPPDMGKIVSSFLIVQDMKRDHKLSCQANELTKK